MRFNVVVESILLREGRPTGVAQVVFVTFQEESSLIGAQPPALRAQGLTGDLFVGVHADVLGKFAVVVHDRVALKAFVACAHMIHVTLSKHNQFCC